MRRSLRHCPHTNLQDASPSAAPSSFDLTSIFEPQRHTLALTCLCRHAADAEASSSVLRASGPVRMGATPIREQGEDQTARCSCANPEPVCRYRKTTRAYLQVAELFYRDSRVRLSLVQTSSFRSLCRLTVGLAWLREVSDACRDGLPLLGGQGSYSHHCVKRSRVQQLRCSCGSVRCRSEARNTDRRTATARIW